jgi:hypothetical protein
MATTTACDEHEIAFIRTFVEGSRRDRYLELRVTNRTKWLARLPHNLGSELLLDYAIDESVAVVRLAEEGVDSCWMFSESVADDQKSLPVNEGIYRLADLYDFGTIVSFIPGTVACFRAEWAKSAIWLMK